MRRKLTALLAGAILMFATSAFATQITGSINFLGGETLTGPTTPVTPSNATGVLFPYVLTLVGTGDYSSVATGTHVSMTGFTFDPFTSPINNLWSFSSGNKTYSFDLLTVNATNVPSSVLSLAGTGMLHISGFDETPGQWVFTTADASGGQSPILSFSASSAAAVPEPGTMVLLGFGMLGLAIYGKRRMNKEA